MAAFFFQGFQKSFYLLSHKISFANRSHTYIFFRHTYLYPIAPLILMRTMFFIIYTGQIGYELVQVMVI